MDLINKWIQYIPKKKILLIKLNGKLNNLYNQQTNLNYIIIFDIEFLRFKDITCVNELGAIILCKIDNYWYLVCLVHFNLPSLTDNIDDMYLLMTKYNTLSKKTEEKNIELENKLFEYYPNDNKFHYRMNGQRLKKNKKQYELFIKIMNNVFNDKEYKKRLIKEDKEFMKITNILFNQSYLIVKGKEDFKAINNQLKLLKIKALPFDNYFDIAIYNQLLFKKCDSAELEKSYQCLEKLNIDYSFNEYIEFIEKFTKLKAHNPLVDSYMTWVIYNVFLLNKIT